MKKPPVPADADLRDFSFMPLDVMRLTDSDLTAISTGDEFKAAVLLWCKSWHQVPASSLPNDDRTLAHLAGYGRDIKGWKKVKDVALKGFILCDDGRLYHPVIAEKAVEAAEAKAARAVAREGDSSRKQRERAERAELFSKLKAAGIAPKWNTTTSELRGLVTDMSRPVTVTCHAPVTVTGPPPVTPPVTAKTGTGIGTGILDEVVARARDRDADLEAMLRKAAGWQNDPSPKLAITGPIQALIDAGADLDQDVLPVIQAIAPQADGRSWNYFVKAIARARDQRIAAATIVSLPTATRITGHGTRPQKPSRAETFDAIRRRIDEIAAVETDDGTAPPGHGGTGNPAEGAA